MNLYHCYAIFYPEKINLIESIKNKHLNYIKSNAKVIHYGGIITNEAKEYDSIVMIIKAKSKAIAIDFIKNDPYFKLYKKLSVDLFQQKIPAIVNEK